MQVDRLPADMIERIEIIRNPTAEYDASGIGGTINIVLKNRADGVTRLRAAGAAVAGRRIVVKQDGQAHDLAPPSECRAGTCGECRMTLTSGKVRWLLPAGIMLAANEVLPCVCTAEGDLHLNARGFSIPACAGNPDRLSSS